MKTPTWTRKCDNLIKAMSIWKIGQFRGKQWTFHCLLRFPFVADLHPVIESLTQKPYTHTMGANDFEEFLYLTRFYLAAFAFRKFLDLLFFYQNTTRLGIFFQQVAARQLPLGPIQIHDEINIFRDDCANSKKNRRFSRSSESFVRTHEAAAVRTPGDSWLSWSIKAFYRIEFLAKYADAFFRIVPGCLYTLGSCY